MPYKDPEKDQACKVQWQKDNPQKHRVATSDWARRNPEKVKAQQKRWAAKNPERMMLRWAKKRAKQKGIPFSIEATDIIIPLICPILGIPIHTGDGKLIHNTPTLDRIDPTKGYVKDNVWVISWRANKIKSDATLEELEKIVSALLAKAKSNPNG